MMSFKALVAAATLAGTAGAATAADLTYTPINPSFGGNPLNSGHLLSIANAQRSATARDANDDDDSLFGDPTVDPGPTDADLFVRQLQGRLLSALASQVTEAIFGDNPTEDGTVTFGTTTVTFSRDLGEIRLTIIDSLDGTVTEIVVPQLVSSS